MRSANENGDESGLRVEILSIVHHSRRRYRQPKWTGKRRNARDRAGRGLPSDFGCAGAADQRQAGARRPSRGERSPVPDGNLRNGRAVGRRNEPVRCGRSQPRRSAGHPGEGHRRRNETYDILVDGVTKVAEHSHSTGTGIAPSTASFSFDADGSQPVVITLQRTGGSFSLINGLELTLTAPYEEPPLVISSASLEAGRINLTIDATGLQTSQVQRTFFLESNDWQTVTTIVIDSSSVLWSEPATGQWERVFYRIISE